MTYFSKKIQSKSSRRKRCIRWSLGETRWKLPKSSPGGVTQNGLNSYGSKLWQHWGHVTNQPGSVLETQHLELSWGWSPRHPLPGHTKIPDSQQESRGLHKPWCLYNSLGPRNHSSVRERWNSPQMQVPRGQPGPATQGGLSEESSLRPLG